MKTIIAGSRGITDYQTVWGAIIDSGIYVTEVVSGGAKGVDLCGEKYASKHSIPIIKFIPDWSKGKRAGIDRNNKMAEYADALVAVWDGVSRGTEHMINAARKRGLEVFVQCV